MSRQPKVGNNTVAEDADWPDLQAWRSMCIVHRPRSTPSSPTACKIKGTSVWSRSSSALSLCFAVPGALKASPSTLAEAPPPPPPIPHSALVGRRRKDLAEMESHHQNLPPPLVRGWRAAVRGTLKQLRSDSRKWYLSARVFVLFRKEMRKVLGRCWSSAITSSQREKDSLSKPAVNRD